MSHLQTVPIDSGDEKIRGERMMFIHLDVILGMPPLAVTQKLVSRAPVAIFRK